jgi:hypothetical protein
MKGHNGHNRDPREIEADLDRTRAQLGNTLEELQRKLSPGEFFDQALSYVRSSGGGEFVSNLRYTVAQNPVPVGLVGFGLAWLMMSGRGGGSVGESQLGTSEPGGTSRIGGMASDARARTTSAARRAREGLGQARTSVERVASGGRERVHQLSHGVRENISRVSSMGRHGAVRARSGFEYLLNEQPLVLGAVGIALGAALAAGLPRTQREDELLGEARDEFLEDARAKGQEQVDKARRVAESARDAAQDAARQEAERQGLAKGAGGTPTQSVSTESGAAGATDDAILTNPPRNRPI